MGADQHIDWNAAAASALDWWREAGVDTLVEEAPRDWLKPVTAAPAPAGAAPAASPAAPATMPANLREFEAWRIGPHAPDSGWGTPLAPQGNAESGLMVLFDLPERDDAATGQLLSGDLGRLFDRMLAAIGRDRQSIYLASLAAARPVSGQIAAEMVEPLTHIARHLIALARPKRLLLLGNAASRAVLGANASAARQHLHVLNHEGGQTEAVASFHPRFLLQHPARKAEAWRDLQMVIGGLDA
jgi:DNA polymerase